MTSSAGAPRLPAAASTLVTPVLPSDGYKLALRVESEADFLLLLAQFPMDAGGAFSVAVDLALRVDPPFAGQGRVLLRLLACDAAAAAEIERMALASADPLAPRYCAMPGGRTLADLCAAFPLADRVAGDAVMYRAQAVVSGSAVRDLGIRATSAPGPTSFFLDACEAVGGANGVLASCLEPAGVGGECFRCAGVPPVGANCSVPPAIRPALTGGVRMDLCDASRNCLMSAGAFASLPLFYALAALVWAAAAFLWSVHIQAASGRPPRPRSARRRGSGGEIGGPAATTAAVPAAVDGRSASQRGSRESVRTSSGRLASVSGALSPPPPAAQVVVELQLKMRGVPLSQSLASALAAAALFLEGSSGYASGRTSGTSGSSASPTALSSLASSAAALAAALALALLCELLLLLAKGWQITRATLAARERQWLRALAAAFALLTAVLRHSRRTKHLAVALLWGAAWAALVGAIWFHSALNLNALRYQLAVLRTHLLALQQQQQRQQQDQQAPPPPDVRRTPVYVKLQLFRRFRALLALYLLLACVLGVAGLAADADDAAWQWTTLAAADGLTLLLAAALGHTFRCRRFRELLPPSDAGGGGASGPHRVAPEPQQPVEPQPQPPPPLVRAKSAMVVVVSPGQEHALGTAYAPAADAKKEPT